MSSTDEIVVAEPLTAPPEELTPKEEKKRKEKKAPRRADGRGAKEGADGGRS